MKNSIIFVTLILVLSSTVVFAEECTDSDGGNNVYVKGTITTQDYVWTDFCSDATDPRSWVTVASCDGSNCYQREHVCEEGGSGVRKAYNCPYGCHEGVCLGSPPELKPDLTITAISLEPENPQVGEKLTFHVTTKNIGEAEVPSGISYEVCDYMDGVKTNCNQYGFLGPFGANEVRPLIWSRATTDDQEEPSWPAEFSVGDHTFRIVIDDNQVVDEILETNNDRTKTFTVSPRQEYITICTDPDGGKNYYVSSVVHWTYNEISGETPDGCVIGSPGILLEIFCEDNSVNSIEYECPYGCSQGACTPEVPTGEEEAIPEVPVPPIPGEECTDSDGGRNHDVRGTAKGSNIGGTDFCGIRTVPAYSEPMVVHSCEKMEWESGQKCTLYEYACGTSPEFDPTHVIRWEHECLNGCQDGACKEEVPTEEVPVEPIPEVPVPPVAGEDCIDSDGGNNPYKKSDSVSGKMITAHGYTYVNQVESCITEVGMMPGEDVAHVIEYYCEYDAEAEEMFLHKYEPVCPNGCKDGACIIGSNVKGCEDSDGGNDYYAKGETKGFLPSGEYMVFEDYCTNGYTIPTKDKIGVEEGNCGILSSDGEYFLEIGLASGSNIVAGPNWHHCPHGCDDGACLIKDYCDGCLSDTTCLPFGIRKEGKYCSQNTKFVNQLGTAEICENSYECKSNLCIDGECIAGSFIRKVINWFRRWFGL